MSTFKTCPVFKIKMSDPGNMDNATDIDRDLTRMCEETHRANTYRDYDQYVHHPKIMAKAGFYELDKRLICFRCKLNIDISDIGKTDDIVEVHQTKSPSCIFARNLPSLPRSRLVVASDLRYETKRLETFIDWPGKVTGNVPIRINKIISKIIGHQETDNEKNSCDDKEGRSRGSSGEEDGGDSRESENDRSSRTGAGYGDQVNCFHCGVGIRNWERDDDPWTQHAMWNPECYYVRTLKGQTYIDTAKMVKSALFRKPTLERTYSVTDEDWNAVMGLDITKDLLMSLFPVAARLLTM
ncbi:baculoviral IAP repeat-containing protein 3-like [Penaeus indicus]|uniref:baculoviral IAP repeat-containing protein 3-like n=1 Tax=Penaeus indicus TaxID=29960 RepID=UPI00300CBB84